MTSKPNDPLNGVDSMLAGVAFLAMLTIRYWYLHWVQPVSRMVRLIQHREAKRRSCEKS